MGAYEDQTATPNPTNNILYVKKGGAGTRDGSSWTNALPEVAAALKFAKRNQASWTPSNVLRIWVAGGTYKPMYSPNDGDNLSTSPADPRDVSFLMVNNVVLEGGFAGNETSANQVDLSLTENASILSGDIGIEGDDADNTYQVLLSVGTNASPVSSNTTMNGFTIQDGNANISNARTVNTTSLSRQDGGGVYNFYSSQSFSNLTISGNAAKNGAACITRVHHRKLRA